VKLTITLLFAALSLSLLAQFNTLSYGPGYQEQFFYNLETEEAQRINHDSYDIYVSTAPGSAAIYVNEGVSSSMNNPQSEVKLYITGSTEFSDVDTANMERIYNDESIAGEGAFNHIAAAADPFDLGWGGYDPVTHTVSGNRIFVVQLQDGSYHKLFIKSLASGTFIIQSAPLDAEQPTEIQVNKEHFSGPYAFISLSNQSVNDYAAGDWDLWFTRYTSPLDDGSGNILQYVVAGALLHPNIAAVKAEEVDPAAVEWTDYESELESVPNVIGYDWKEFNITTFSWTVFEDLVYFVERTNGDVWQLQFIDFEGSSTGGLTIRAENVGMTSAVDLSNWGSPSLTLYPNPINGQHFTLHSRNSTQDYQLEIISPQGSVLHTEKITLLPGNSPEIRAPQQSGTYYLRWIGGGDSGVIPFIVP
jgi:hypothetical protein